MSKVMSMSIVICVLFAAVVELAAAVEVACPFGRFRVIPRSGRFYDNQIVQVILARTNDNNDNNNNNNHNDTSISLRVCVACPTCNCQDVGWADRNLASVYTRSSANAMVPLVRWFQSFRDQNARFLSPLILGVAKSFESLRTGNIPVNKHISYFVDKFYVEDQDRSCVQGVFSFSVDPIHPEWRSLMLAEGDLIDIQSMQLFADAQTYHNRSVLGYESSHDRAARYVNLVRDELKLANFCVNESCVVSFLSGNFGSDRVPFRSVLSLMEVEVNAPFVAQIGSQNASFWFPKQSSEEAFCNRALSFCKTNYIQTEDCFKMIAYIKRNSLAPTFLHFDVKDAWMDLDRMNKIILQETRDMTILYVVLSDHPTNAKTSCVDDMLSGGGGRWGT